VQHSTGVMIGELIIFASGNKAEIKGVIKDRAKEIAECVRGRITEVPAPAAPPVAPPTASVPLPTTDPAARLKQLAELRDAGVITPEDFEEKKKQIFGG
jgi:hypothetical protein